ncbi:MAG: branched-chain amino acid transporter permease [Rhodospirillales bacterium]|jgi:branched-chain amino acid transport system permease protein|nr:branched-chain amino acid transporter permease [Rhodospirillales bacterium]
MDNLNLLFQAPVLSLGLVLDGVLIGAIFALAAFGLALVWGVMGIINVSQGEFVMLGGYVTYVLAKYGLHPLATIPIAAIVLWIVGWVLYRTIVYRIVGRDMFISLLATFGISQVLSQGMNLAFGASPVTVDAGMGTLFLFDGNLTISGIRLVAFALSIVIAVTLWLFLRRSRLGQSIRATAQNPRAARILGIDVDKVYAHTFALNAAICGAAGALVAMAVIVGPTLGLIYTLRAFLIGILGGLGSVLGSLVAGIGLGAAENLFGFLAGSELQQAFTFLLLVAILVVRNWRLQRHRKYLR